MNIHKHAKLTPLGRARRVKMMLDGHTPAKAAAVAGVCPGTARKWLVRYQTEGRAGLQDHSSRPKRLRPPTPARTIKRIIALRRQRLTGRPIAQTVGVSPVTVSRVLKRAGLSRLKDLEPAEPARRSAAGSRRRSTPYIPVGVFPDPKQHSALAHLKAALACYRRLGVTVKRVMTDNGPCDTSHAFAATGKQFGLKHIRTKPYTPRTNGKAERFIQTALREWAYARAYLTSTQRARDLPLWTHSYHWHRPHSGITQQTPVGRLNLNQNNLLRFHSYSVHDVYAAWAPANGPFSGLELRAGIDNVFNKSYQEHLAGDSGKGRAFKLAFVKQF